MTNILNHGILIKVKKLLVLIRAAAADGLRDYGRKKTGAALAKNLLSKGYEVVFLGGEQEHEKNSRLAKASGGKYLGFFNLEKFINLVNQCDLVVTGVTMGMAYNYCA